MIIDQLIAIPSPQSDDELPIERGQLTYKIKWSDLAGNDIGDLQSDMTTAQGDIRDINTALSGKQATLVSGTNIKTLNGQSVLGSGDLSVGGQVHVGTSAPSDPNIQIWLDTDEPGMSGVSSVNGATGTVVLDAEDVGATAWDLVWENASPTSSFGAQTISLDLSGYSLVAVFIRNTTGSDSQYRAIDLIPIGVIFADKLITMSGTNISFFSRVFTTTQNGITCSEASKNIQGSSATVDNTRVLPDKIYGIKGVTT